MKRNIVIMLVMFFGCGISVAQDVKKDSLTISGTVDKIYSWVLRELDNVQIQGSHPAAQEVRQRWNQVVNHLMNNKSHMAEDRPGFIERDYQSQRTGFREEYRTEYGCLL